MNPGDYLDFELRIWGESGHYYAEVTSESSAGSSERVVLDTLFENHDKVETLLLRLENALLRGRTGLRGGPLSCEEKALRDFGQAVFNTIFGAAPIARLYAQSRVDLENKKETFSGIRVRLRIDTPDLARFPWEYLYNGPEREWLGLVHKSPIVRRLDVLQTAAPLQLRGPLNILAMIANPGDPWGTIDAERERHRIDQAIAPHEKAGTVRLSWVPGDTREQLMTAVGNGDWHVFHFIGHGGVPKPIEDPTTSPGSSDALQGYIVLSDGQGSYSEVDASDLRTMLQGPGAGSLQLVVLNCCESARAVPGDLFSSPAAALVRTGIPAVVAMQFPIGDEAAIQLSGAFYGKLAEGSPIELAMTEARRMMWAKSRIEWGIPVLYTRSKTGRLFTGMARPRPRSGRAPAPVPIDESTAKARARLRDLYREERGH